MNAKVIGAAIAVFLAGSASAQLRVVDEPYQGELPIAAAVPKPLPIEVVESVARVPELPKFEVLDTDKTMRDVLARWAETAHWTFRSEHWSLDRDLPMIGATDAAYFERDFKAAVRTLVSASEMTDRAGQPCFYSNRVLRIIPQAESCDETASTRNN